jgi:hypothetical protein
LNSDDNSSSGEHNSSSDNSAYDSSSDSSSGEQDTFLSSVLSAPLNLLFPTPIAMNGVRVVPDFPSAECLFLTKKLDRSYLSSDSVMIDTNAEIALKEPNASPDSLIEGKKEPFLY